MGSLVKAMRWSLIVTLEAYLITVYCGLWVESSLPSQQRERERKSGKTQEKSKKKRNTFSFDSLFGLTTTKGLQMHHDDRQVN
jgi:hypothetical protein